MSCGWKNKGPTPNGRGIVVGAFGVVVMFVLLYLAYHQ